MEIDTIKLHIQNIKLPYQAEHSGMHIINHGQEQFSELKNLYYEKLHSTQLTGFLDNLLEYLSRILDAGRPLLSEEVGKAQSLLDNILLLSESFELNYNKTKYEFYLDKLRAVLSV